jgi:hypothetical protein
MEVTDPNVTPVGYPGDEDELMARFQGWEKSLHGHWDQWQIEARLDYDYVAGRQWTTDEMADMIASRRVPVTINRIAPTVDAVCGAEIQGRQQVQYYPREVGDTAVDDVLTQGADWIMDRCDGNEEDSDAFRDCIICGIGVTETRVDVDLDTNIIKERISPLEMMWDPTSRKSGFSDARYLRRQIRMSKEDAEEMAEEMGWPEDCFDSGAGLTPRKPVIVDPRIRYTGENEAYDPDEVSICEWQWFDKEIVHLADDGQGGVIELTPDEHGEMIAQYPDLDTVRHNRKKYYKAWTGAGMLLGVEPLELGDFTYTAITGKRDQTKGWWYGLVRPMRDPQKWANRLYSQLLHIMRHNSQGGLMVEEGAVDDIRQLEETWADPAAITYFANGALSSANGSRMQVKPQIGYPTGMDRLMEIAATGIRDATGVNQELLGLADRQQPGVLEQQRKQAAYGILSSFFDGLRRYHRMAGRKLLRMMQLYLPPDKLVRVVGEDGSPQYVPLALKPETAEYDVVVDEAATGPNQKVQTFQILTQMMPLLSQADLPDSFWAEIVKYSPLPASLASKIATILTKKDEEQSPEQQQAAQMQKIMEQLQLAGAKAGVRKTEAEAADTEAKAAHSQALSQVDKIKGISDAQNSSRESEAKADLDRAKTAQIMQQIVTEMNEPPENPND